MGGRRQMDDLVAKAKEIRAKYHKTDYGSFKDESIDGDNFTISKQGKGIHIHHTGKSKKNNTNRKIGYEE